MANNINKPKFNFTWFYMIVGGVLLFIYLFGEGNNDAIREKKYSELKEYISKGYIGEIIVYDTDEIEAYVKKDSAKYIFEAKKLKNDARPLVVSTLGSRDNFENFINEHKKNPDGTGGKFDGTLQYD